MGELAGEVTEVKKKQRLHSRRRGGSMKWGRGDGRAGIGSNDYTGAETEPHSNAVT